ncbi:hypothetical protein N7486_001385 [Penicillium sp. IBT 16267x]|nr:hypothetical protein N7486_001385 [Penicillium sp. IBT 16267x]
MVSRGVGGLQKREGACHGRQALKDGRDMVVRMSSMQGVWQELVEGWPHISPRKSEAAGGVSVSLSPSSRGLGNRWG